MDLVAQAWGSSCPRNKNPYPPHSRWTLIPSHQGSPGLLIRALIPSWEPQLYDFIHTWLPPEVLILSPRSWRMPAHESGGGGVFTRCITSGKPPCSCFTVTPSSWFWLFFWIGSSLHEVRYGQRIHPQPARCLHIGNAQFLSVCGWWIIWFCPVIWSSCLTFLGLIS